MLLPITTKYHPINIGQFIGNAEAKAEITESVIATRESADVITVEAVVKESMECLKRMLPAVTDPRHPERTET